MMADNYFIELIIILAIAKFQHANLFFIRTLDGIGYKNVSGQKMQIQVC